MRSIQISAWSVRARAFLLPILLGAVCPNVAAGYAVLAHEAIVDATWDSHIRPLLVARFPTATPGELKVAHGYAYGGAIIQDLGYYPHGSHFFSDLTHYVRSGDFILTILRDSQDMNGYWFALGALSHYAADNQGHSIGTNRAVPILYPELKKKYGPVVTYEDNPLAHVKGELELAVWKEAPHHIAPAGSKALSGSRWSAPWLGQLFQETY